MDFTDHQHHNKQSGLRALSKTTTTSLMDHHHGFVSFYGGSRGLDDETCGSGHDSKQEQHNNRTTDGQTMMHILKANIGTGVLAMPNAFKHVGLWLGFVLIPIIGAICIHCMNILIASHNHLCDRFNYESLDYDQVAALGLACGPVWARRLAKKAHIMVTVFLIFTQVGFCCVYIMFVVENIQLAVLNLFNVHYSTTIYLLLVFPLIGLTSCTSNLKHLARISTLANILQLTGLALIFFDLLQFHTYSGRLLGAANDTTNTTTGPISAHQQPPNIQVKQAISGDIRNGLPLFFATAVYAFEGIGVVLPLIKEMQYPSRISGLNGVLNTSMSTVAVLYMGMGFFGYAKYGQFVQGSITLNLPETILNEIVRMIFAIAIGLSYSLQFYVPWTIIWPFIDESLFYSYRPRESRDKLGILNKLSAENEWSIDDSGWQQHSTGGLRHQRSVTTANGKPPQLPAAGEETPEDVDNNSTASTFATSYAVSTYHQQSRRLQPQQHLNLSTSLINTSAQMNTNQYGAVSVGAQQPITAGRLLTVSTSKPAGSLKDRRRNRLEDVMEQEDDMPEVQWRPPPRSMRGKRKLVRYTVILVSVSFTFVAAALIPRLDLFIALIGALASSCLAIIFPAIIQMCTFWVIEDEEEEEEDNNTIQDQDHANKTKGQPNSSGRRKLVWWLFVCKNLLLIVFGILGLITGSWISLSQLSAAYMGIASET